MAAGEGHADEAPRVRRSIMLIHRASDGRSR
jgi:hypothetical protein